MRTLQTIIHALSDSSATQAITAPGSSIAALSESELILPLTALPKKE